MTFKELVDKYTFEDIVQEMNERWGKPNIYLFRQALDLLRALTPDVSDNPGKIEVSRVNSKTESYDRVMNLSGFDWCENLGWDIKVSEECSLTEKQLLALLLWERTFYGFSPQQERDTADSWADPEKENLAPPDNPYFRQMLELERKIYHRIVKPKDRRYDSWGEPRWPEEYPDAILPHKKKCRQRKAQDRYYKRLHYLGEMSERAEMIKEIVDWYSSLSADALSFLMSDTPYYKQNLSSVTPTLETAVDYILESMDKWAEFPKAETLQSTVALLCMPEGYVLKANDKARIEKAIESLIGVYPKQFHQRNTTEQNNLSLTLIYQVREHRNNSESSL